MYLDLHEVKKKENKKQYHIWVKPSTVEHAKTLLDLDNCASFSEFAEKAIQFYAGYVASNHNQEYLPNVIISVIKSIMRDSENRHNRNLYRIALELSMLMNVMAATHHIPEESLQKLRGECEEEIRRINGSLSLDTAVKWQN